MINYDNISNKITLGDNKDNAYSKLTLEKANGNYTDKIDNIVVGFRKELMENGYACTGVTSFYILSKYLGTFNTYDWASKPELRKKISDILSKKDVLLSSLKDSDLTIENWR